MGISEGPFQRIVDVYFPDEGDPTPTPITHSVYALWGIWTTNTYGWAPIHSSFISGQPGDRVNVVRVINSMTPEVIEAPADIEGGLEYDAEQEQYYRVITRVTGKKPNWEPGDQYIFFSDPVPNNYFVGSTCKARAWTVVFREYYFFLGIHHHEVISSSEYTVDFSAAGVVLRGVDGYLYTGGTFETDTDFPRLIVTAQ